MKALKKLAVLVSGALLLSPISSLSSYSNLIQTVSAAEETVTASSDYWDGTTDTSWYDSEQAEFHLTTAEELAGIYVLVNSGKTMENQTIYLDTNIYLNDISNFDKWSESAPEYIWTPIGTNDIVYFAGTFDGSNHTINGLYRNEENETLTNLGLFGYNKGVIKNVMISSSFIKYEDTDDSSCDFLINIGGVCGTNYNLISNCTFNGYSTAYSVVDSDNTSCESKTVVGGICGDNSGGSISKCYNSGKVFSKSEVDSSCSSGYEPVESYATSYSYAGGICGVSDGGTIECSINNGSIDAISSSKSYAYTSYSYSSATSYHASAYCYSYAYAGGICGYGSMVLNECKNNGDINASYSANCEATIGSYRDTYSGTTHVETEANSGGICGYTLGNITNSYNNGNINSNKYSGGIGGYTSSSISNSYNVGTITGETCGGICGYSSSNTTLDKCYYLSGTAVKGVGSGTDNTISKAKANMQTPEFAESLGEAFVYLENNFPQLAFQNELKFAYFTKEKVTLNEYAQSEQLELVTTSYQTPTWISSDTNIATVENGVVTAKNNGECTIYAVCGEARAECKVIVDYAYSLDNTAVELEEEQTVTLNVISDKTGNAATGFEIEWTSSDKSVATVANGTVTAVNAGTATITAGFGNNKLECEITVNSTEQPTEVPVPALNFSTIEIYEGETAELIVNNYTENITWISDNTTVAIVTDGVIKAKAPGTVRIYAMLSNGTNLICNVTVNEAEVTTTVTTKITTTTTTTKATTASKTTSEATSETIVSISETTTTKVTTPVLTSSSVTTSKKTTTFISDGNVFVGACELKAETNVSAKVGDTVYVPVYVDTYGTTIEGMAAKVVYDETALELTDMILPIDAGYEYLGFGKNSYQYNVANGLFLIISSNNTIMTNYPEFPVVILEFEALKEGKYEIGFENTIDSSKEIEIVQKSSSNYDEVNEYLKAEIKTGSIIVEKADSAITTSVTTNITSVNSTTTKVYPEIFGDCPVGLEFSADKTNFTLEEVRSGNAEAVVYIDSMSDFSKDELVTSIEFYLKSSAWGKIDPINLQICSPNELSTDKGNKEQHFYSTCTATQSIWDEELPDTFYSLYNYLDAYPDLKYSEDYMPKCCIMSTSQTGKLRCLEENMNNHIAQFDVKLPADIEPGEYTIEFYEPKCVIGDVIAGTARTVDINAYNSITFTISDTAITTTTNAITTTTTSKVTVSETTASSNISVAESTSKTTTSTTQQTTSTSVATTQVTTTTTPEPVNGDVNEDGIISIADVILIQKALVKANVNVDFSKIDINNDGKFNVFDLIIVKRLILMN